MLAVALAVGVLVIAPTPTVRAVPGVCPPICDAIPDAAWIAAPAIPLYSVYRWPGLAGLAVTAPSPRFGFEALCESPRLAGGPRDFVVAARAVVLHPEGQWNLVAQVLHWRGDVATGADLALSTLRSARARLAYCQLTAPQTSPSITTDEPQRLAAVISAAGEQVMHEYLVAHPRSSSVVELAMWSTLPPAVGWPPVPDAQVFEALTAPLCKAYLGSCR